MQSGLGSWVNPGNPSRGPVHALEPHKLGADILYNFDNNGMHRNDMQNKWIAIRQLHEGNACGFSGRGQSDKSMKGMSIPCKRSECVEVSEGDYWRMEWATSQVEANSWRGKNESGRRVALFVFLLVIRTSPGRSVLPSSRRCRNSIRSTSIKPRRPQCLRGVD